MRNDDVHSTRLLILMLIAGCILFIHSFYQSLSTASKLLFILISVVAFFTLATFLWNYFSPTARERKKKLDQIRELPGALLTPNKDGICLGEEVDLQIPLFLPDSIRTRHVHVVGATGSGKTESVILNFLKQDVARGLGAIIIDGKGDHSFLKSLKSWVPQNKLQIFDLSSSESLSYDPLRAGSALEAAQRLYSSLVWSEEYYASKARSVLQAIFQKYFTIHSKNPSLKELSEILSSLGKFSSMAVAANYPLKMAEQDFIEIAGLRDQVNSLTTDFLGRILSSGDKNIDLNSTYNGQVIYFRLQSLMSPQIAATVGKLVINHLNFLAGTAHRGENKLDAANGVKLVPTYVDEFATFACIEFADLIAKARSAGFALHFSHQSVGDLNEISKGFINRITDNSATKIIMRINDPDSADFFARSFGTKMYSKFTQRVTNSEDLDRAETVGEGTMREAHQFRSSPDLFKTLPTGMASILIAHGCDTPHGASSVFKVRFPQLNPDCGQIIK